MSRPSSRSSDRLTELPSSKSERRQFGRERIYLQHACYICGSILSSAKSVLNHIDRIHNHTIPPREPSRRRLQERDFEFVPSLDLDHESEHIACPSCWFHCPAEDLEELNAHTIEAHDPQAIEQDEDEMGDYDMPSNRYNRRRSNSMSRRNSRPSSRQSNSRPSSRQSNSRPSSRQSDNRPSSRQSNRSNSRARSQTPAFKDKERREITKKFEEITELFKGLFNSK